MVYTAALSGEGGGGRGRFPGVLPCRVLPREKTRVSKDPFGQFSRGLFTYQGAHTI